ncbi:MAG: hypothetical protein J0M11_13505 [Anaerolineae bacterium]|jgi:hypothetical protein|nr:hypothetical protein [Anaerolineae bacterium]
MKKSQLARYLLLLLAALLAVFSIGTLTRLAQAPEMVGLYIVYSLTMLIASILLLASYFWLRKKNRVAYYLTVSILVLSIVLTIFDQIGLADVVFILLNAAALTFLYMSRDEYLSA